MPGDTNTERRLETLVIFATAAFIGSLHALEPDHMAAVGAFTVRRPHPLAALGFGARWALGHGGIVVIAGALLLVVGQTIPDSAGHLLERLVGVTLVGLGAWTVSGRRMLHVHPRGADGNDEQVRIHAHPQPYRAAGNRHAPTMIGALHGLAGTAPVLALVPATQLASPGLTVLYLIVFSVGTAAGMSFFALLAGSLAQRAAGRSLQLARAMSVIAGIATICIGLYWMIR